MNGRQIDAVHDALAEKDAEIKQLRKENIDRLMQKAKLEEEIQRLKSSPTVAETDALIARLRTNQASWPGAVSDLMGEAAEALHRLARNQMSTGYVTLAQTAALQAQEAEARARYAQKLEQKCDQLTNALMKAMTLVDELLRENGRLCAASGDPPNVRLFAAKSSFDTAMHKLLGDEEPATTTADTTEVTTSLTTSTDGETK
jgi:DNA repair exonuclease SbcCD ATPase subunit